MRGNLIFIVALLCVTIIHGAPHRTPRDTSDAEAEISPVNNNEDTAEGLNREKRKLVEPVLQSKNAVLGFVFGKINSLIDSKTKFIDTLDKQNIAKNKQHNIESPKPINNFQDLISGVITPKITAITGKIGSLSGGFLGGSSGGGSSDGSGSGGGLGNIVSSLLRLSGPLLAGGSGGSSGGGASAGADASKSNAVKVAAAASGASSAYSGAKAIFSGSSGGPTRQPYKTTTDDTPDFDRNKVSLVVPDELFGNSFTLVTNVSKLMGDFIMNSARRTADFFVVLQPILKKSLTIENPPPTTTTTESSNDI
ncbi:uncharacterized protein LOC134835538 [Culicoides brevitarsis]|uniref:uncharacterized protein LOC134835538 n=1 Tax=Culicoides brevitarsis TaxID=469753 RepID=UPI00307C6B0D